MPADHATPDILLIAPTGMLGRAWRELLEARDLAYETAGRPALDLTNPTTIRDTVQPHHRLVINCAAWTDVDGAETHEAEAMAVNGTGVGELAARCGEVDATLVHYSTDYVFNGKAAAPYRTDEFRDPVNAYGRTKAQGERLIERSGAHHLIVRTSWLYAPWGRNFVLTMARLASERDTLRVVHDQRGRPTSAEHLAATTLALLDAGATGTFHVCDGGECTWFEFAREIARLVNPDCTVEPCTTDEFPRPAPRPAYSVLDLSDTQARVGPMPPWTDQLAHTLARREHHASP